ncbi:MAG: cyclomaltodextrinase N-terminal domain-containing protein [Elusimicrobia bacterium]|nr:cyclomaltodextrinase N-terminal domain-containing protein [Elusimicrobiota bacterium]
MRAAAPTLTPQRRRAVPAVTKLDPPSWWAGSSLNPLRLMITGRNLGGARVTCEAPGVSLGAVKAGPGGRCLFVDLKIAPRAAAGKQALTIITEAGRARADFEILAPVPRRRELPRLSPDDVVYLIMPDRFAQGQPAYVDIPGRPRLLDRSLGRSYHGGNLRGIIDKLGYLKDLGATALWLTPLYANSDRLFDPTYYSKVPFTDYHGYGPVDFYAVDKRLGDMETLRELVDKAHQAGIKIILDQVANHTSPHHPWVADPPTPTWYHGTTEEHLNNPFHYWLLADPYAAPQALRPVMEGWLGNLLPDLNQDDPEVERYLIQNILWWAGVCGFDAWRHDSLNYVPRAFWKKCMAALRREFPTFPNIAEVNSDDPYLVSFFQGGKVGRDGIDIGMDACFDFPLRRAVRNVFLEGKPMSELPAALSRDRLYPDPTMLVTFLGLHDDSRFMGHPKASPEALKLAFAFLMTTRGIPMVYAADEIAMAGGDDPDNRRDFPGGWPGDPRDAFSRAGRTAAEQDVFAHVRKLAALRAELKPLRRGRLVYLASDESFYAYARCAGAAWALIVLNNSDRPREMDFSGVPFRLPAEGAVILDRLGAARARVKAGAVHVAIPPKSAALFACSAR